MAQNVQEPAVPTTTLQIADKTNETSNNTMSDVPTKELVGMERLRLKLKPLLLYVVSTAQFLDIGKRSFYAIIYDAQSRHITPRLTFILIASSF